MVGNMLIFLVVVLLVSVEAFMVNNHRGFSSNTVIMGINPRASGFASTKAGKSAIVERTKALIDTSSLIITVPFEGTSVEQVDALRKSLPEGTTASVVKNKLMKVAVKDTAFSAIGEQDDLVQSNIFFFIPEGEAKPTFKALKSWAKEENKKEAVPKFGCMEGTIYRNQGLDAVSNLPTKLELYTKIAQGIKAVPTKVGRSINAVPNKFGRAFGALKNKLEEEANA